MKPKWQKLASLPQKYADSSFSSLVQSLLPKDTLLRTYSNKFLNSWGKMISAETLLDESMFVVCMERLHL